MTTWITHILHARAFSQVVTNSKQVKKEASTVKYSKKKMIVQALMFKKMARLTILAKSNFLVSMIF